MTIKMVSLGWRLCRFTVVFVSESMQVFQEVFEQSHPNASKIYSSCGIIHANPRQHAAHFPTDPL